MFKKITGFILIATLLTALFASGSVMAAEGTQDVLDTAKSSATQSGQVYYDETLETELDRALGGFDFVSSEAKSGISLSSLFDMLTDILSSQETDERYAKLITISDQLSQIYAKLNNIEDKLNDITKQLNLGKAEAKIEERHSLTNLLNTHSTPVFESVAKMVKNPDGSLSKNWFEKNYKEIYSKYLKRWGDEIVAGNSARITVLQHVKNISIPSETTWNMNMLELFDSYAKEIYPWEHLGYKYRETERLIDLLSMLQNVCLLDMYYTCVQKVEGIDYSQFYKQLINALKTYSETYKKNPVTHNDNVRICQIKGLEGKKFAVALDYLDLFDPIRKALQNSKFNALSSHPEKHDVPLLDNAFSHFKSYTNPGLTEGETVHTSYTYQPASTYEVLSNYYKTRVEKHKADKTKYGSLPAALATDGFTGVKVDSNIRFVYDPKVSYKAYWEDNRNRVEYRIMRLVINPWQKNRDDVILTTIKPDGTKLNEDFIINCNFAGGYNMDEPGRNHTNRMFVSLREVK